MATNPTQLVKRDIKHLTDVVGMIIDREAPLRLTAAVLKDHHDEWAGTNISYLAEANASLPT